MYCKKVSNALLLKPMNVHAIFQVAPLEVSIKLNFPVPTKRCESKPITIPRVSCEVKSEKRCIQVLPSYKDTFWECVYVNQMETIFTICLMALAMKLCNFKAKASIKLNFEHSFKMSNCFYEILKKFNCWWKKVD